MRLGKGSIRDLIKQLDEYSLEAAAEVIAEDISRVDLKEFVRALLDCCPIECIARAVAEAETLEQAKDRTVEGGRVAPGRGLEPPTTGLTARRST